MSDKRYALDFVFSITTYGHVHLGSNYPAFSVLGLRRSNRFPRSNSHNLTFGFVHALVCSEYFFQVYIAISLSYSSRSFSSASFGHGIVFVAIHRLRCFISSVNIASAPYISRKGVKFVALQIVVLWIHPFSFLFPFQYLFH
jgi:hypothetical protein